MELPRSMKINFEIEIPIQVKVTENTMVTVSAEKESISDFAIELYKLCERSGFHAIIIGNGNTEQ